ncbi:hypothetical protein RJ640_018707 [Escallonia rubra]|uniref:Unc-50-like protein n=1 Tax=Escallonia rubra TaxID=112253 RepID=A0AA88RUG2_9ASTE|nr:hypothetical protein RJ640_018707 [Escallonia rubra]
MLPTVMRGRTPSSNYVRANPAFPQYLRRIVKVPSSVSLYMSPCESYLTFLLSSFPPNCSGNKWILSILSGKCFIYAPRQKLCSYQHTKYHKQTKNQWARDDPAFIVICSLLLAVSTLAYCAAYDHSAGHAVFVVISVLLFHFLITGALLATCCWLYAFDVHCNSFFPVFVLLCVIHYFLSPILVAHGFIPVLLSNLLYMVAISYYHYLNFLGYDVLPFLERTTFFLYPIGIAIILSPILILSGFNPSRYFMNVYFSRWL